MVFVVSPVEVDVAGIQQQEGEKDEENLDGVFASVDKVSIKHVWLLHGRHSILEDTQQ